MNTRPATTRDAKGTSEAYLTPSESSLDAEGIPSISCKPAMISKGNWVIQVPAVAKTESQAGSTIAEVIATKSTVGRRRSAKPHSTVRSSRSAMAEAPAVKATADSLTTANSAAPKAPKAGSRQTVQSAVELQPSASIDRKTKLVRDGFTMPSADFDLIALLKTRLSSLKRPIKKSELLQAGIQALVGLSDAEFMAALNRLAPVKRGRSNKSG